MAYTHLLQRWQLQAWYILTYCNVDSFGHGIYSPIVTLTVSVMVYTHLLKRWQFRSWYILSYCNVDTFRHGIYSPIVRLTVSGMVYTHLLQRWQFRSWYILTYCNVDCFGDVMHLTIYNIIAITRIDATFTCRKVIYHQKIFSWQLIIHIWLFVPYKRYRMVPSASQLRFTWFISSATIMSLSGFFVMTTFLTLSVKSVSTFL